MLVVPRFHDNTKYGNQDVGGESYLYLFPR